MAESQARVSKERGGRKRLPKELRRSEILKAAEKVFSIRGYEAATISEVAGCAKTAEGNVYRYFETKRDLLAQVIAHWYETRIAELQEETRRIPNIRERLKFLIRYHITALKENPGLLGLIIREVRTHNDAYEEIIGGLNRRYTSFISETVKDGVATGMFRDTIQISLARDMIFGCIEHHTWRYLAKGNTSDIDVDRMTDQILVLILKGFEQHCEIESKKAIIKNHMEIINEVIEKL